MRSPSIERQHASSSDRNASPRSASSAGTSGYGWIKEASNRPRYSSFAKLGRVHSVSRACSATSRACSGLTWAWWVVTSYSLRRHHPVLLESRHEGNPKSRLTDLGHDFVGSVEVGEDVLYVVAVLEGFDQPYDLAGGLDIDLDGHGRDERLLGGLVVEPGFLQRRTYGHQIGRFADDLEGRAEVVDLLGTGVEYGEQDVVLAGLPRLLLTVDDDDTLAVEQVRDRAGVGHRTAGTGHRGTHFHRGTVLVVGQTLDEERDPVRSVALVHDGGVLDSSAVQPAAALDRALDVVVGNRRLLRLLDRVVQGGVAGRVGTAHTRGDLDVLDQLREHLAAPCIDDGLLVLGRRPLGVACHGDPSLACFRAFSTLPGRAQRTVRTRSRK